MLWKKKCVENTLVNDCISYNKENLDKELTDTIDSNINMSVPWYLMASYAYYEEDDPILSDAAFDRLTRKMVSEWKNIKHEHKDKITLDMLNAGTYIGEYPSKIEGGLKSLRGVYKIGTKRRK